MIDRQTVRPFSAQPCGPVTTQRCRGSPCGNVPRGTWPFPLFPAIPAGLAKASLAHYSPYILESVFKVSATSCSADPPIVHPPNHDDAPRQSALRASKAKFAALHLSKNGSGARCIPIAPVIPINPVAPTAHFGARISVFASKDPNFRVNGGARECAFLRTVEISIGLTPACAGLSPAAAAGPPSTQSVRFISISGSASSWDSRERQPADSDMLRASYTCVRKGAPWAGAGTLITGREMPRKAEELVGVMFYDDKGKGDDAEGIDRSDVVDRCVQPCDEDLSAERHHRRAEGVTG